MTRLPPQRCASCGQILPKEKPASAPAEAAVADRVRAVREATERRNQEGSTGTRDALEGGVVAAAERKGQQG